MILGVSILRIFPTLRRLDDRWGVSGSAMTEARAAAVVLWRLQLGMVNDGGHDGGISW